MPVNVSNVEALPATKDTGVSDVIPGTGLVTLSKKGLELPPLGCGFTTTIGSAPELATSVASTATAKVVELTKPVLRLMPLTDTEDTETKLFPVTKSVKLPVPAVTPEGESDVICGTGLGPALIMNVRGFVVPPPGVGVVTVTNAVPAFWMSLAVI